MKVAQYNPKFFNTQVSLETASECFDPVKEKALSALSEVIIAAGLQHIVAIQLLHRHFNLEVDEVLVEDSVLEEINKAFPTAVSFSRPYGNAKQDKIPSIWCSERNTDSFTWHPLEFISASLLMQEDVAERDRVMSNTAFLHHFAQKLDELEIAGICGLSFISSRKVATTWEYSDESGGRMLYNFAGQQPLGGLSKEAAWQAKGPRTRVCVAYCGTNINGRHYSLHAKG